MRGGNAAPAFVRTAFFLLLLGLPSCAGIRAPALSPVAHAPDSVRDGLTLDLTSDQPSARFRLTVYVPPEDWIRLGVVIENNRVFSEGRFAHNDDDPFERVGRLLVDTGFNGHLHVPLGHPVAGRAWVSAELGRRRSTTLTGRHAAWTGAGSGLEISGIVVSPIPMTVATVTGGRALPAPLLGQSWFDLAEATWIDLDAGTIAVSFEQGAARAMIRNNPDAWIGLAWKKTAPDGHRFVPIRVGDQTYDAVIDTGSVAEVLLDAPHPPPFVDRPWVRANLRGGLGSIFHAKSAVPVRIGDLAVHDVRIAWTARPSGLFADAVAGRPFAVLGVPFLRRFPVLLDHRNDRAYFFAGDPSSRPMIGEDGAGPVGARAHTRDGNPP